jgi:CYTH domain-containing protein
MDNILEIDVFIGNLKGLIIVEVEFNSEKDSLSFLKPN